MRHFLLKIVPRESLELVGCELCSLSHARHTVLSREKVLEGVSQFLPRIMNSVTSPCSRMGGYIHCSSDSAQVCSMCLQTEDIFHHLRTREACKLHWSVSSYWSWLSFRGGDRCTLRRGRNIMRMLTWIEDRTLEIGRRQNWRVGANLLQVWRTGISPHDDLPTLFKKILERCIIDPSNPLNWNVCTE